MLKVFIGFDHKEIVAYQVCAYSIIKNASKPVAIIPLNIRHMVEWFDNADYRASTEFAFTRFLIPHFCDFAGNAVFMDCDMLVRSDIHQILKHHNPGNAVSVVKHDYEPIEQDKFLGQLQTVYPMKNWSSVMVFQNDKCKALDTGYVNNATGLSLHRFKWTDENKIGSLPPTWNYLVGEPIEKLAEPDIVHFTRGGPYFKEYENCEYADEWWKYWKESNSVLDRRVIGASISDK
jgi:lipopolysaccharide biosynthesis glycosyltransferase